MACGILVPLPGMKPGPLAMEAWSPNHWTIREFPTLSILDIKVWALFLFFGLGLSRK